MTNGHSSDRIAFDTLDQFITVFVPALMGHTLAIRSICTQVKVWSEVE